MTPEELQNLILLRKDGIERLDPERKGRANTTFSYHANLPILAECIDQNIATGDKTLQFPKDSQNFMGKMTLAKKKWPSDA